MAVLVYAFTRSGLTHTVFLVLAAPGQGKSRCLQELPAFINATGSCRSFSPWRTDTGDFAEAGAAPQGSGVHPLQRAPHGVGGYWSAQPFLQVAPHLLVSGRWRLAEESGLVLVCPTGGGSWA